MDILGKLDKLLTRLNKEGIRIPLLKDPKANGPSVSLTFVVISFGIYALGLFGKFAGFFGGVDLSQAAMLFGISSSLYFGRQAQINSATKEVKIEKE